MDREIADPRLLELELVVPRCVAVDGRCPFAFDLPVSGAAGLLSVSVVLLAVWPGAFVLKWALPGERLLEAESSLLDSLLSSSSGAWLGGGFG